MKPYLYVIWEETEKDEKFEWTVLTPHPQVVIAEDDDSAKTAAIVEFMSAYSDEVENTNNLKVVVRPF